MRKGGYASAFEVDRALGSERHDYLAGARRGDRDQRLLRIPSVAVDRAPL
jgi:hypothetical protein